MSGPLGEPAHAASTQCVSPTHAQHCAVLFCNVLRLSQHGRVVLPDLYVSDSSEALLSGRKPPFRLVVRARHKRGQHIAVRPAVSEAFVVATRRVKTSHKVRVCVRLKGR